ncbi:cysteine-rich RLK (RECEPTOR-like protein kinase) 8 [Abeliophyllum distichum]|uniref:Cysteine-rich RLK (RECEPTOR-like protein kinase) 8 n=1 Tax=Abeliophyllum distichum TaxID=126358 RepID=A0ABD1VZW6_9LAMI
MLTPKVSKGDWRCNNIIKTKCTSHGRLCSVIIDGGSYEILVSQEIVKKLYLEVQPHPKPYCIAWFKKRGEVKVTHQCLIPFSIGNSDSDKVVCDVVEMESCHLLLGRPWRRGCTENIEHTTQIRDCQETEPVLPASDIYTELPHGKKPVGCKWIFTIIYKADKSIERFKARLVAKGFTQSHGIDYHETFAPVAKLNKVRILLSLAVNQDWPLHQLDVKNAFLNGNFKEEVYMEILAGLENPSNSRIVCKLKKLLYGLKQSPHVWFDRFAKAVITNVYSQCQVDHMMFVKSSPEGKAANLIFYVDDIILTENDAGEIAN